jgi:hypothetical protein
MMAVGRWVGGRGEFRYPLRNPAEVLPRFFASSFFLLEVARFLVTAQVLSVAALLVAALLQWAGGL